jgi:hypothetical protein
VDWYVAAGDHAKATASLTVVLDLVQALTGLKPETYLALREPEFDRLRSSKFIRETISKTSVCST